MISIGGSVLYVAECVSSWQYARFRGILLVERLVLLRHCAMESPNARLYRATLEGRDDPTIVRHSPTLV